MNRAIVVIEYSIGGTFVYRILSDETITIDKVAKYFEETEGFNEQRDSLQLMEDELTEIKL